MTAEELLMMSDDVETYIADDALVIDPESRTILTPVNGLILGVESDEEAERIKFVCPRIVGDNIDLSTLQLRAIYRNANGNKDFRICTDITIDGENIRFSWSLSRKVTRYKGMVNFIICAIRTQSDGSIKNEWNTTLAEGTVLEGLEVDISEEEFEEPKDIVLQLLGMLDEKATEIMKEIDKYLEKLKIDNNLDVNSENAIQNKVVAKQFNQLSEENVDKANSLWAIIQKTAFAEQLTDAELLAFKTAWGIESGGEVEPDEPSEPDNPELTLSSISATYNGGNVAVGTPVNSLTGITVTAHYSDGSTANVTGYTLSGTIAEGTNTITVSYGGKTTTFTVVGAVESGGDEPEAVIYNVFDGEFENSGYSGILQETYGSAMNVYKTKIDVSNADKLYWRVAKNNKSANSTIPNGKLGVYASDDTLLGVIDISKNTTEEHSYFNEVTGEGLAVIETLEDGTAIYSKIVGSVSLQDYPNKSYIMIGLKNSGIAFGWSGTAQSTSPLTLEGLV